eukprot:TRINITY_DN465_c0_g2_i1.p1 TRINITY_DN465_c0_g2~~TRINITY_DN465_c0_g2_i1.p1  ORF type:complete len:288 (-),score=113.98 TRINITY_DN465_c0_g2_i1:88-951(-)
MIASTLASSNSGSSPRNNEFNKRALIESDPEIEFIKRSLLSKYPQTLPTNTGNYRINIVTGKIVGAATTATVTIQIFGTNYFTPVTTLSDHGFTKGSTITMDLQTINIGSPKLILIEHLATRDSPSWFLESLSIHFTDSYQTQGQFGMSINRTVQFECHSWLSLTKAPKQTKCYFIPCDYVPTKSVTVKSIGNVAQQPNENSLFEIQIKFGGFKAKYEKSLRSLELLNNEVSADFQSHNLPEFPNRNYFCNKELIEEQTKKIENWFTFILQDEVIKNSVLFQRFLNH